MSGAGGEFAGGVTTKAGSTDKWAFEWAADGDSKGNVSDLFFAGNTHALCDEHNVAHLAFSASSLELICVWFMYMLPSLLQALSWSVFGSCMIVS
jgi:hypothetical protein